MEKQILEKIQNGKTEKEISKELYISSHTVKSYISAISKKLQKDKLKKTVENKNLK